MSYTIVFGVAVRFTSLKSSNLGYLQCNCVCVFVRGE